MKCTTIEQLKRDLRKCVRALLAMPTYPVSYAAHHTDGDEADNYTDYCTGADGHHEECSNPRGETCGCPCHWLGPIQRRLREGR